MEMAIEAKTICKKEAGDYKIYSQKIRKIEERLL